MSVPFPATHAVFHDPAIWAAERSRLFGGWVALATRDQLARPGARVVEPLAGQAVTLVRTAEGVTAAAGEVPWTVVERGPLLFGAPAPAAPLSEALGPAAAVVDRFGELAAGLLFEVRQEIGANWKLVVSGAIEDYHLPHVHGRSLAPWRREPAAPTVEQGGHSSYTTSAVVGPAMRLLLRLVVGRTPPPTFENYLVYPNLLLIHLLGLVHVTRFVPLAIDRTLRVTRIYTAEPRPGPLNPRRAVRALLGVLLRRGMQVAFEEDRWVTEEAQAGTAAAQDLRRGPAHAEEVRVEHLLAETARRLRSG